LAEIVFCDLPDFSGMINIGYIELRKLLLIQMYIEQTR
jgi:hypothetical protein